MAFCCSPERPSHSQYSLWPSDKGRGVSVLGRSSSFMSPLRASRSEGRVTGRATPHKAAWALPPEPVGFSSSTAGSCLNDPKDLIVQDVAHPFLQVGVGCSRLA